MLWETETLSLFSAHSEPYSETLPTSGMTRNGSLLPLPTSAHATDANACSSSPTPDLLPTPVVTDSTGTRNSTANRSPGSTASSGDTITDALTHLGMMPPSPPQRAGLLLPTPRATDGTKGGPNQRGSSGDLMLPSAVCHLDEA